VGIHVPDTAAGAAVEGVDHRVKPGDHDCKRQSRIDLQLVLLNRPAMDGDRPEGYFQRSKCVAAAAVRSIILCPAVQ
jgi:hypothetical protein